MYKLAKMTLLNIINRITFGSYSIVIIGPKLVASMEKNDVGAGDEL